MTKKLYTFDGQEYKGMRIVHVRGDQTDYNFAQNRQELLLLSIDKSQDYHIDDFDAIVFDHVMVWGVDEEEKITSSIKNIDEATHVLIKKETFNAYFKACLRDELLGNPLGRERSIICEILSSDLD